MKFAAGSVEPKWRETKLRAEIAGKAPKSRSEISRAGWRNDPLRDEKISSYIGRLIRERQPVRLSVKSAHTVWAARKNLADATRSGVRIIPDLFVPPWDHSSDLMKTLGWALAAKELGATPVTLRLSDEVVSAAVRSKIGPSRYLQDRIARHLRSRLPDHDPTFWFAVEKGQWEQAHLHGAIVIPTDQRPLVRQALMAAGGAWEGGATRQVHFSTRKNQVTWVGYSTKWLFATHRRLARESGAEMDFVDRKVPLAATQSFRSAAKKAYQTARAEGLVLYP